MLCNQFQERLDTLLDERVCPSMDPELQQHAACCGPCHRVLAMHLDLLRAFDAGHSPHEVTVASSSGWAVPSGRWSVLMAAACAVIVAAITLWPEQTATQIAAVDSQPVAVEEPVAKTPDIVDNLVVDTTAMPNEGDGAFVYQPLISIGLLATADWDSPFPAADVPFVGQLPQVDDSWRQAVVDGMSPVQASMNTTLNLIARSITRS